MRPNSHLCQFVGLIKLVVSVWSYQVVAIPAGKSPIEMLARLPVSKKHLNRRVSLANWNSVTRLLHSTKVQREAKLVLEQFALLGSLLGSRVLWQSSRNVLLAP